MSRQFLPVSRQRIESLLAQFPRLLQTNQQHTYVETEHVRFVYQPLESHYLVLTTTKGSNILQDMETLRLMARVVIDFASPLDDPSVLQSAALEILLAFDELITLGWRENVNMTQLQTILAMESQEEIIQEIIAKVRRLIGLALQFLLNTNRIRCRRPRRRPRERLNRLRWRKRRLPVAIHRTRAFPPLPPFIPDPFPEPMDTRPSLSEAVVEQMIEIMVEARPPRK